MRSLCPPVLPFRGFRTVDGFGSGGYGAPRDGGARTHAGLDVLALADKDVSVASFDCVIAHAGRAYADAELGSLHLIGVGEFAPLRAKLLYSSLLPNLSKGCEVPQGAQLGLAQDVAAYHQARRPDRGPMQNHLHFELRVFENGVWQTVDPIRWFGPLGAA